MEDEDEKLVKVVVDLPNHWATGGEGFWATPLGDDLYQIENVPFYAYGLNFLDVVRAVAPADDKNPVILEVVRPSGRRTLRLIFDEAVTKERRLEIMEDFPDGWENADSKFFALDLKTKESFDAAWERLSELEQQGILDFESCEARVPGSFDDAPSQEE